MREFEDRFVTLGLPYRVIGGPRFYERAEIRDALAYLRVVNSPADDLAFERIVNVPKRGLGDATVQLLHDHARKRRVPLTEAARAMVATDELKPKPRGACARCSKPSTAGGAARRAAAHRARRDHPRRIRLHRDVAEGPLRRRRRPAGEPEGAGPLHGGVREPAGFLEHISLVMDNEKAAEADAVKIMTLHSAKGLEFDTVFLPGWEEGLFPHQRTLDDQGRAGLEEERRLAHVGLTRAQEAGENLFRHQPPHARAVADQHPVALSRRIAGSQCRGDGRARRRLRRLWRLRRLALRRRHLVRLQLQHPRLAARARQKKCEERRGRLLRGGADYDADEDLPLSRARERPIEPRSIG